MPAINLQVDQTQVDAVYFLLKEVSKGAETALSRAMNFGVSSAVTETARGVSGKVTLTQKLIKQNIKVDRATRYRLGSKMVMRSRRMPLAAFQTTPSAKNFQSDFSGNGVAVKVWKDKPSIRFRHAFFAVMPNGYIGLFERNLNKSGSSKGTDSQGRPRRNRLPINELVGPYLASVYDETPGLSEKVEQTSSNKMLNEMNRQVNVLLGL